MNRPDFIYADFQNHPIEVHPYYNKEGKEIKWQSRTDVNRQSVMPTAHTTAQDTSTVTTAPYSKATPTVMTSDVKQIVITIGALKSGNMTNKKGEQC